MDATASSTPAETPAQTTPLAGSAAKSASGIPLRGLLFALVLLVPVGALGYVFYDVSTSGGIRELPDGYKFVNLQAMSTFAFDQEDGTVDDVPEPYRELDGQKVVLQGEMWNDRAAGGRVSEFDLVYSVQDCCLVGEPQVQHFVRSRTVDGQPVRLYRDEVRVRGTLRVDVTRDAPGGPVTGVYHLDVEDVEPV